MYQNKERKFKEETEKKYTFSFLCEQIVVPWIWVYTIDRWACHYRLQMPLLTLMIAVPFQMAVAHKYPLKKPSSGYSGADLISNYCLI